jgi:hypothetical protein
MTLKDEQWAELAQWGICTDCQATHTVNVAQLHLSFYCQHSLKAAFMVAGWATTMEGLALKDYLEFVTDLQRRIGGVLN